MSYYKILGFEKEPFSTSPDPEFFYESREHETALTNLIIEMRLKRGLSVILGDVGTGKTTLSRKLCQLLKEKEDIIFHMILDPSYEEEKALLASLIRNFDIDMPMSDPSKIDYKEALEKFLFKKGIEEKKTVVLIVDEAQTTRECTLETLRMLLNYETNEHKLLQVILLGQMELHAKIMSIANFFDRISFKYTLNPMDLNETRKMIEYRMRQAGYRSSITLFSEDAFRDIHKYTKGYPRQIAMLCHKALKALILKNKFMVDKSMINGIINEEVSQGWRRIQAQELLQKSSY